MHCSTESPITEPNQPDRTRWTLVRRVSHQDPVVSRKALGELYVIYKPMIEAYLRRHGGGMEDAADLTQEYFERAIHRELFQKADPSRGRLRNLLFSAAQRLLADKWAKQNAQKRGSGIAPESLDAIGPDGMPMFEPSHNQTPDRAWMHQWAMELLRHTFAKLEATQTEKGKAVLYHHLRPLMGYSELPEASYQEISSRTGIAVEKLRLDMLRLRREWRDILWQEVSDTLDNPTTENIREELRELRDFITG